MGKPNVTSLEASRCLSLLQRVDEPIAATGIASALVFAGSRETRRRRVRAIIKQLREDGAMIVATNQGYILTDDIDIWKDYLEGRQIDAKRVLAVTHEKKRMAADSKGQGLLFGMGGTSCGK